MADLKELLGDELYAQVTTKLGDKVQVAVISDGSYLPKTKLDEVIGQKNQLKTQITDMTAQLDALKVSATGNEALTKTIAELQAKNTDAENKYKKSQITSAIKFQAQLEKARDANDILSFVNHDKITFDDSGNLTGLSEQLVELKKTKSYLFDIATTPPSTGPGTNPPGATSQGTFNAEKASMDEYMTEFNKRKG